MVETIFRCRSPGFASLFPAPISVIPISNACIFRPLRIPTMSQTYQVIGTRPIRHDGLDKVTGRALYGADFQTAGLLHGRVLRSPHAHAKIKKIDVTRALALPGVEAIITSADFPDPGDRLANLGEGAI